MKLLLALFSLLVFSVSCSSPKEKYEERQAEAREQYDEDRKEAQEELREDEKEEAVDYVEDSDEATIDRDGQKVYVED